MEASSDGFLPDGNFKLGSKETIQKPFPKRIDHEPKQYFNETVLLCTVGICIIFFLGFFVAAVMTFTPVKTLTEDGPVDAAFYDNSNQFGAFTDKDSTPNEAFVLFAARRTIPEGLTSVCVFNVRDSRRRAVYVDYGPDIYPYQYCSFIMYCCVSLTVNDTLETITSSWENEHGTTLSKFTQTKMHRPSLKITLGIGGSPSSSSFFQFLVRDEAGRLKFSNVIADWLQKTNLNGLSLYWTYPKDTESKDVTDLTRYLSNKLSQANLTTSLVIPVEENRRKGFNLRALSQTSQQLTLIISPPAYTRKDHRKTFLHYNKDLIKSYSRIANETEQSNDTSATVCYMISIGAISFTLNLSTGEAVMEGSPVIGPGLPGPSSKKAGSLAYYEICAQGTFDMVREANSGYSFVGQRGDRWISFSNSTGLAKYLRDLWPQVSSSCRGLWDVENDDFAGLCRTEKLGKYPLLQIVFFDI